MQSGDLSCNVTNCAHNFGYECKAGAINIGGGGAVENIETTCTTFVDKAKSSFVNSIDALNTDVCNIKCEASNCVHNENKGCHADNVQIDVQNACCNTFECE
ncbi:DUF1540 domain-containing protein [Terrisporobacter mayombei]|uniref:DUF1540 domain-containing protein n=1 Tax=Terrisporobacter mayombei TaxID=1541 RepID=A0ABY9Q650_9FIRM|nr:DUF1540 domain-containing protein [Terrisporobacter mayombei]MCC3868860.1 DUF1540 domain-containing protein [Terrisporobacter mayombei]WMT83008.1 hypothetical protein TEMA_35060 [Terrisporobacter mayombei]